MSRIFMNDNKDVLEAEAKVQLAGFSVDELLKIALLLRSKRINATDLNNNIVMFKRGYESCVRDIKLVVDDFDWNLIFK